MKVQHSGWTVISCDSSACRLCQLDLRAVHCLAMEGPVGDGARTPADLSSGSSNTNCSVTCASAQHSLPTEPSRVGSDCEWSHGPDSREHSPTCSGAGKHSQGRRKRQRLSPAAPEADWLAPPAESRLASSAGSCSQLAALGHAAQLPRPRAAHLAEFSWSDERYAAAIQQVHAPAAEESASPRSGVRSAFVQVRRLQGAT